MPTYEYECTACGLVFEEQRPITAPARQRCPRCRHKVKRLISGGSGIVFKGSGFYVTDSRGKKESRQPAADQAPAPAPADGKSDAAKPPVSSA